MAANTIACTGASGFAGTEVVAALVARGASVRGLGRSSVLSAAPGIEFRNVNFDDDDQMANALRDVSTVVHCASTPDANEDLAIIRKAYAAAVKADVRHFVFIGVVGIEGALSFPYFKTKAEGEALVRNGPLPWTIQRATQFYEFIPRFATWLAKDGEIIVPTGMRWRPVAAKTVGARLASLALGPARGRVTDVVGPDELDVVDMIRQYIAHTVSDPKKRPTVREGDPADPKMRWLSSVSLLGDATAEVTGPTFTSWLQARPTAFR